MGSLAHCWHKGLLFTIPFYLLLTLALLPISLADSPDNYKLSGPGLSPDKIVLPCRYFFVERISDNVENGGDVFQEKDIKVSVEGVREDEDGRFCRAWTEILGLPDGGFMVRYRFHQPCHQVKISVLLEGQNIEGSPLSVQGQVLSDHCNCPLPSLPDFISASCPAPLGQMDTDLAPWAGGVDMKVAVTKARETFKYAGSQCWCHYAVKDGEVWRRCYGQHTGFSMFWDQTLLWLASRARLPDLELLVNLGDWPLVKPKYKGIPMFSWCGSKETSDMVFPTYELTEASLECMGRQSLDTLAALGRNKVPWSEKTEKLFWRGRDSRQERLDLVRLAKKHPESMNASITAFFFFRDQEKDLGREPYVSFFDFFNYKYQMNIDGTVAAYRLPFLLAGGALVFKVDSPYYEHFYHSLVPWQHYVPVKADLSDLLERIQWAKDNDQEAHEISRRASEFVRTHLTPHPVLCYHAQLLHRWAGLMRSPVSVEKGMEKVERKKDATGRRGPCGCEERANLPPEMHTSKEEL